MTREEKVEALSKFIEALDDEWGVGREVWAEHIQQFIEDGYDLNDYAISDERSEEEKRVHDQWICEKVKEALKNKRPGISHDEFQAWVKKKFEEMV